MVGTLISGLHQSGTYQLPEKFLEFVATGFAAGSASEGERSKR